MEYFTAQEARRRVRNNKFEKYKEDIDRAFFAIQSAVNNGATKCQLYYNEKSLDATQAIVLKLTELGYNAEIKQLFEMNDNCTRIDIRW